MDERIQKLIHVIRNGEMENTYKTAWARALVEHCLLYPNKKIIHFDALAQLIFGYYWNQTIFFDLRQGPNHLKKPELYQYVKNKIEAYQSSNDMKPELFNRVQDRIEFEPRKISRVLRKDVCHRFLKCDGDKYDLYDLDQTNLTISLDYSEQVKEHADILFDLINYRWAQKLEDFNSAPRISQKVKCTDRKKFRRNSLTPFRKFLDLENPNRLCFISGKAIDDKYLSVDHVIPWSFMYSDDLWNLVYVDRRVNSAKSNRLPSEELIANLETRNVSLLSSMQSAGLTGKHIESMKYAIEKDHVRKFWVSFKG